ncbi:hypothetical protein MCJ35_06285 [Enterocloster sp. OA13]|uniref:hypothetical protein n=1 Tax=Enterocloster sp. OA13 TaxID=2914161 RepID=UPI001F06CF8A|nr:hypothetical protein [Enterocloster sp. OA13]
MANILQVTGPSLNPDHRNISDSQRAAEYGDSQKIQNPVDPSRVVRADGQKEGKSGDATGERSYSIIDYESNYGAFIKNLGEGMELPGLLEQLFSREMAGLLFGDQSEVGELVERLLSSVKAESPEELLSFLKGQQLSQAKFSGPFFDGLRNVLFQDASGNMKEAVLAFLKTYNDYSSGSHFLQQMHTLTDDISHLLMNPFRDDFRQLMDGMDWEAANGDTAANTSFLNGRLIPFLSNYISRSHDYGAVRDAVMHLIFHAVRYENGNLDRLQHLFDRVAESRGVERFFKDNTMPPLDSILNAHGQKEKGGFADAFSSLLLKGAGGEAGVENIQQFYQIMNGMLLNESVYLPLLHILFPFQYQGKDVMSEIWADPDAGREGEDGGRKIKMLFHFDVQGLGRFEMLMVFRDRVVDMQLGVPPVLAGRSGDIQEHVAGIMKKNGLDPGRLLVREKTDNLRIEDVFPEIRDKERTINVRI